MEHYFNIGKNLQQENFKEILQKMSNVFGWEILEGTNLLALKAPVAINFVNFVWGETTLSNIEKVKVFYKNTQFTWLVAPQINADNLKCGGFALDDLVSTEMVLNISEYITPTIPSNIQIIIPKTNEELQIWTNTAIATFECSSDGFKEFFYPLIKVAKCIPFLLMYDNQPAATAMVYCGNNVAGVYCMSTLTAYRHKCLGTAAVNACILLAKSKNLHHAILYASQLGRPLYAKLGFKEIQILQEYHLENTLEQSNA